MAAVAILDIIKVPFLRRGLADSYQIWYADAEWHPVVESIPKIIFFQNQDGDDRHLKFRKSSHNFAHGWRIMLKLGTKITH